ncbi:hypothetical protein BDV41DRAFT_554308 [Aspergillus transmontanensis]|uniref:Uncharacterized protein n=1 Tax=Aspergillus transmontanensis TaxID=1034304 RepID=A0A5N6VGW6_9EURO|nr:hypothetical protein BDV41DRAFT_554308 [Aspergillus transmontanensis]
MPYMLEIFRQLDTAVVKHTHICRLPVLIICTPPLYGVGLTFLLILLFEAALGKKRTEKGRGKDESGTTRGIGF